MKASACPLICVPPHCILCHSNILLLDTTMAQSKNYLFGVNTKTDPKNLTITSDDEGI
jgi:hypothetical protein